MDATLFPSFLNTLPVLYVRLICQSMIMIIVIKKILTDFFLNYTVSFVIMIINFNDFGVIFS